jgi:twitching motility two-component system response regulator PilH
MSLVLLADDSAHAQRMGERILREEGFEVLSVADGETAAAGVVQADPDVVLADAFLPHGSGFDLCRYIKGHRPHVRVVLTAGLLEAFDEDEARRAGCDGILRKPFEASVVIGMIRPLAQEAQIARGELASALATPQAAPISDAPVAAAPPPPDPERVQAAIALAIEAAKPALVREITEKVLVALGH